jgi:hypothetical protein
MREKKRTPSKKIQTATKLKTALGFKKNTIKLEKGRKRYFSLTPALEKTNL